MVDRQSVLSHLRELDESLADWERYKKTVSKRDLTLDRDKRNMTLHALLVAVQAAIDIASHLVSEHGLRTPNSYRETFEVLAEAGVLPEQLSETLATLAGFRNILVHVYWRLDIDAVTDVLMNDLDHMVEFRDQVRYLLGNSK